MLHPDHAAAASLDKMLYNDYMLFGLDQAANSVRSFV